MSLKEKEAGKRVTLIESQVKANDLLAMISTANTNIINYNKMVDNYNDEKKALVDAVWKFLMDEQEALISVYLNDLSSFAKAREGIQKGIKYKFIVFYRLYKIMCKITISLLVFR